MSTRTLAARAGAEMLGSLMTYCLAVGSLSNALLPRTKGEGMGLLPIALGVGIGIALPIAMFNRVSAIFNPGILLAQAVRGLLPGGAGAFFALLAAELAGYFTGALVLYLFYLPHFNAAVALPAADEVDRLLRDPAALHATALKNASYSLAAPAVSTQQSFWRFALQDLGAELRKVATARKVADPFRTCPEDMRQACEAQGPGAYACGLTAADDGKPLGRGDAGPGSDGSSAAEAAAEAGLRHRGSGTVHSGGGKEGCVDEAGEGAAPTYAQRLAAGGGGGGDAGHARGALAAALCKARQDVLLSVFVTRPAVWSPFFNLVQEFIAMALMATGALLLFEQARYLDPAAGTLYPAQAALMVGLLNSVMVLALGGATGPAMNPGRDLGPRLAFHLLPIPGKGSSEWHYAWVPLLGGLAGGAAAGGLVAAISQLLE